MATVAKQTKQKEIHMVPTESGWANRAGTYTLSRHKKKELAVKRGRKIANERNARLVIHKQDGSIAR